MKKIWWLVIIVVVATSGWFGVTSSRVQSWWTDLTKPTLPAAENAAQATVNTVVRPLANANLLNQNAAVVLPTEKNLAVPFTSQAPNANWDADHEEFCEEAAMLMVGRYYQGRGFANATDAENGLQAIKQWEIGHLGFYFDTTAAENATILTGIYGVHVELLVNPTITQIKTAIAAGHPVIVPSAGRQLGNPNFKTPGPIYHNLVIRGYTANGKFITNDPGTRKGEEYLYSEDVIMKAMHDWVPAGSRIVATNGDVANGRKVVLVVSAG